MAAVKLWFQRFRPLRLYIVLILTTAYFLTQLVVSHVTHALTLLVDSYHVLCNLIALIGCIITIKYGSSKACDSTEESKNNSEELKILSVPIGSVKYASKNCGQPERELRNTFGWARIDVLVMLIGCVFLASLCFSLLVEALQTLIHISHLDEMHHPIPVLYIGFIGLALNLICYLLIGGYTYHQGSFLHVTEDGNVVLESVNENSVSYGQRRLSSQTRRVHVPLQPPKRQGIRETFRDIIGCLFVIVCATVVYCTDRNVAKYIDPIISIVSAILLLLFSYPYMKESCLILLQTIPDHINMGSLETELIDAFPNCIVNIHDFHVWQLTVNKTISTVHIIFLNPHVYIRVNNDIKKFFEDHGISHVTVQPEFFKDMNSIELMSPQCLVTCTDEKCVDCQCCSSSSDLKSISISSLSKSVKKDDKYLQSTVKINSNSLPSINKLFQQKDISNHLGSFNELAHNKRRLSFEKFENDIDGCNSLKSELLSSDNRKIKIDSGLKIKCTSEPSRINCNGSIKDENRHKNDTSSKDDSDGVGGIIKSIDRSNKSVACIKEDVEGITDTLDVIVHKTESVTS